MHRYIDIEPFENQTGITSCCVQTFTQSENTVTVRSVKTSDIPTIDPESLRPHGRWEKVWGSWRNKQCNCCSAVFTFDVTMNYCPNCGANMDLEEA